MAGWYGLLDPTTPGGMQGAGLFSGLSALGAGLMNAGQMRPMGQPGPTMADAFGAFGQGQQRGLMGAYQSAEMAKRQAKSAVYEEARSSKPDAEISEQARMMRSAMSALPEGVRAFADADTMPQLVIDRETKRVSPLTPEQMQQYGLRPGTAGVYSPWSGAPQVLQTPDYKSPEAEAQALRISAAGRAPPAPIILGPGQTAYGRDGRPIASGGPDGQPLSPANAWNDILRYAGDVASGKLDVTSPQGQRYLAAQTILTQPRPVQITQPDGSVIQVMQQPEFPFPRLSMPGAAAPGQPAQGATPPAAPAATPGTAPPGASPAPAQQGVQVKPPPPLTESQGNATMYLARMQEAEKRMADAVAKGYTQGNIRDQVATATPLVGNFMMTEKGQNYRQAQEDWVRAKLRKESGAVIAESEMKAEIKTYFPQPGDSETTIAQKAASRQTAMQALGMSTGPGASRITPTIGAQPAPAARDPLGLLK